MSQSTLAKRLARRVFETYSSNIYSEDIAPQDKERDIKITSRCIAALAVEVFGETSSSLEAAHSVCDGATDNGIDAVYVNHQLQKLVVVQSKYDQNASGSITVADFVRFKESCTELMDEKYHLFNEHLQKSANDISEAITNFDYKILFVYAYTGKKELSDDINRRIHDWEKDINESMAAESLEDRETFIVNVIPFCLEDMVQYLRKQSIHNVTLDNVELLQYGIVSEPYEAIFGIISGIQLAEWWDNYSDKLLEKNIRGVLGNKTDVNTSIKETINTAPDKFWYFNNGITILVEDFKKKERSRVATIRDVGQFSFANASIINGAQTLSTIGINASTLPEGYLESIKVPVRFIKISNDQAFAGSVTRANNHQNRVTGRDFASQDEEQIRIQNEVFVERNYKYNIHRQDYSDTSVSTVIDLDEALSAIVCFLKDERLLATLKSNRGRFYENLSSGIYRQVFNPSVSGVFVINAVNLYRNIHGELQNTLPSTTGKINSILTHGNYAITSIIMHSKELKKDTKDVMNFELSNVKDEIMKIATCMHDYIAAHHKDCYIARFFQNKDKIGEITSQTEIPYY